MSRKIMIVGEAWGEHEENKGRPFVGPSGSILNGLLQQAGIDRADCYLTNVFNFRPPRNQILALTTGSKKEALAAFPALQKGKYIHQRYAAEIGRLWTEIRREKPNLILALGATALWATTKKTGVKKWRGSPLLSFDNEFKVLCTWHPAAIMRQWNLRPVVFMDLCKAAREAETKLLTRPRRKIVLEPTLADIEKFYAEHIVPAPFISVDVETKARTITEVGIATAPNRALVIPFWSRAQGDGNYWRTFEEELAAWKWVARILREKPPIGQNYQYDMQYFWQTMHIPNPRFAGDTMLLHHSLHPELDKGLGFLGSVYTDEPSWKFMRTDHSTLKQADD